MTEDIYHFFADIYDEALGHVPYAMWGDFIDDTFTQFFITPSDPILDIACGTGPVLSYLQRKYDNITGLDRSPYMLKKAEKIASNLVQGDMCALPFSNNYFKGIYCNHDSVNYLLSKELLLQHFKEVYRVLKKDGIYIFDVTTEYNVIKNYHYQTITKSKGGLKLVWDNCYDTENKIITSTLKFFKKKSFLSKEKQEEIFTEIHNQKIYTDIEIRELFQEAGFKIISQTADYNFKRHLVDAELMVYTIKKN